MTEPKRTGLRHSMRAMLLVGVTAMALAGCGKLGVGKDAKAPTGQVVATLDGQEITTQEIRSEMQATPAPQGMSRHDAERLALSNIITRRLLADAASSRKLDKTPAFELQRRRAEEQLRVQALARSIASSVAQPTRDEADKFMRDNPQMFRERRIYALDQIQFMRPDNIADLGFEGAQTMAEVERILNDNNIRFRREPAMLDPARADPAFITEVTKVLAKNPQEVFMFAARPPGAPAPMVLVNQVKESRAEPFTGDNAMEFATNFLRNQRVQNALKTEIDKLQAEREGRVTYQEGWSPAEDAGKADSPESKAGAKLPEANPQGVQLPGGAEGLQAAHDPVVSDDEAAADKTAD